MKKIKFIKDFATKKKGDVWECDSQLASQLVRIEKVAEYDNGQNKADRASKNRSK